MPHEQAQKARRCSPSPAPAAPQPPPRFHASETGDAYKLYIALPGEHVALASLAALRSCPCYVNVSSTFLKFLVVIWFVVLASLPMNSLCYSLL